MSAPEPPPLTFTRIREEHVAAVMAIEREAYPEPWSEGMFRQEINGATSCFYVAFLDGVLVGYVGFWVGVDEAHITSVTVRHDYRCRGLGRQELAFILDVARNMGLRTATLEVRASNLRAQSLYLSMGFHQIGRRREYYTRSKEDAIVMARNLTPSAEPAPSGPNPPAAE